MADHKPAASLVETPEFKAAVADAVSEALKALKPTGGAVSEDVISLFRQMGMTMAEISDQGMDKPKRLPPEVIEQRARAQSRLEELLLGVRDTIKSLGRAPTTAESRELLPWYRTVSILYFNERKIVPFTQDPGTKRAIPVEFSWTGEPNHAMRPINDVAKAIFKEFRASRGEREKVVKERGWMTGNGLFVQGDPPANDKRRELALEAEPVFADDLGLPQAVDPEAPYLHVLGTIAEPAMRNATPQFAGTRR